MTTLTKRIRIDTRVAREIAGDHVAGVKALHAMSKKDKAPIQQAVALVEKMTTESVAEATFLRTLLAEVERVGKDAGNRETTNDEAMAVCRRFEKNLLSILEQLQLVIVPAHLAAGRHGTILSELELVRQYIPGLLEGDDLRVAVAAVAIELGIDTVTVRDTGRIIKALNEKHPGCIDGRAVTDTIKHIQEAA